MPVASHEPDARAHRKQRQLLAVEVSVLGESQPRSNDALRGGESPAVQSEQREAEIGVCGTVVIALFQRKIESTFDGFQTRLAEEGGALAIDLMGGQIPAGTILLSDIIKQHQSGKVRILAVSGSERSPVAPDIPTFRERGFAAMQAGGWQAFFAPAKTPRPVIDRISGAIAAAINSPDIRDRLLALGLEPVGSTADELARHMAEDLAHWAPVVKASGFRADQ